MKPKDLYDLNVIKVAKFLFPSWEGLFLGLVIFLLFEAATYNMIFDITGLWAARILFLVGPLALWILFNLFLMFHYPRAEKSKICIYLSLTTENPDERIRLEKDFYQNFEERLHSLGVSQRFCIILLNNFQAGRLTKILKNASPLINKIFKKIPKELSLWNSCQKKTKAHFYIWGKISKRGDDAKYFIDTGALVVHGTVPMAASNRLGIEFDRIWKKEISFLEKYERPGFNEYAVESVSLSIEYVLGIAALMSSDFYLALELHSGLLKKLKDNEKNYLELIPDISSIIENLEKMVPEEMCWIGAASYYAGDIEKSREFINKSILLWRENPNPYLLRAIIEVEFDKNLDEALKTIDLACLYSDRSSSGDWRYSKAFLLMLKKQFKDSLNQYKKIAEKSFINEERTVSQVIYFITNFILKNPEYFQLYFVLGFLHYKKTGNIPTAHIEFGKFIKKAEATQNISEYGYLVERAKSYLVEAERIMGVKKS